MSTEHCQDPCALAQFFQQARQPMFVTTREGTLTDMNDSLLEMLGYERAELAGSRVSTILDADEDRSRYQSRVETEGVVHDYPLLMRRKDGGRLSCVVDAIAWRQNGVIIGYTGIVRTRQAVVQSLAPYLNDDLIRHLQLASPDPLVSGRRQVTVLFFDIRSSTSIAENTTPENFASFLSDILTDIMDLVCGCKGVVNKLLGDGLLAVFGAPVSSGNDAGNAVEAAIRIRDYLRTFNDVRPDFLAEPVRAGIGLTTGEVFAGLIGSVRMQEYTVLGDPVNLASRLQALTKQTGETILMDETTARLAGERFPCQAMYKGRVRGRSESLRIYGVVEEVVDAC